MHAPAAPAVASDIQTLRLIHCRAEQASRWGHYHVAVQQYRQCLEWAEWREDARATQFFALKLAECYAAMGLRRQASEFAELAEAF